MVVFMAVAVRNLEAVGMKRIYSDEVRGLGVHHRIFRREMAVLILKEIAESKKTFRLSYLDWIVIFGFTAFVFFEMARLFR